MRIEHRDSKQVVELVRRHAMAIWDGRLGYEDSITNHQELFQTLQLANK
jgi:hypothetical protein